MNISQPELKEVGLKAPNEIGLFDMTGNVYEWCFDEIQPYYSYHQENPIGACMKKEKTPFLKFFTPDFENLLPEDRMLYINGHRAIRGASWKTSSVYCGVTCRSSHYSTQFRDDIGLRIARSVQ